MSHYQSKGDRSEAQLKKAGRSSGPGHQRSGAPSTAVKGGGAGGPSPSGSAPPSPAASHSASQSFSAATASGRPTTPGSSTNRGGKRVNGPAGIGRNAQSGGSADHGGNYRNPPYATSHTQNQQQQQQASVIRQSVGPTDANQYPPTTSGQHAELKQAIPAFQSSNSVSASRTGAIGVAPVPLPKQPSQNVVTGVAAKPPAPVVPSTNVSIPEPASPVAAASSVEASRTSVQQSFSFQFGSISPGFMHSVPGMQIPARTSSAPPNLDEQKREQARFEASRAVVTKKVLTAPSRQQQGQVTRVVGNTAAEQPLPILQSNQNVSSTDLGSVVGTPAVQPQQQLASQPQGLNQPQSLVQQQGLAQQQGLTQPPAHFSQGQGHSVPIPGHGPQHTQAPVHIPSQVQLPSQHLQHIQLAQAAQAQAAQAQQAQAQQAQAQAHAQQQSLQSLPQQGLVQQSLSQGMKYLPPHGTQIISQQMGNSLAGQLSAQQVPPQMAHQLGPQMGGGMGGQLPQGISGPPYGPPATNQFIQPQRSRAVKIVNPDTREELRFDAKSKKGEPFMEGGPPASVSTSAGLQVRVSSNGPPQARPNYASSAHHAMVPPNLNYYQQIQSGPYAHAAPPYYQSVPPKGVPTQGAPPVNPPSVRYNYGPQAPNQGLPYMNHPGAAPTLPASKVVPSGGSPSLAGTDMINASSPVPLVVGPVSGPSHPVIQIISSAGTGRAVVASQSSLAGGSQMPSSNGRASSLNPGFSSSSSLPSTPSSNSAVAFKFGDVESSGSPAPASSGESSADNLPATQTQPSALSGAPLAGAELGGVNQIVVAPMSETSSSRRDSVPRVTTAPSVSNPRPNISIPPSKSGSISSGSNSTSPRVSSASSGVNPVDKTKVEGAKPGAISRDNSRKVSKKEQKQHKQLQQQQQQQQPNAVVPVEAEGEKRGEIAIPASIVAGNDKAGAVSLASSTGQSANPKPSLQRSHSGVQSSNSSVYTPVKAANSSGRGEDSKAPKVSIESEKRSSGKSSLMSPRNFEAGGAAYVASEVEEGAQKSFSKQASGKALSSVKSLEEKDGSNTDGIPSTSGGISAKVNLPSSKIVLPDSAYQEVDLGQIRGPLPKVDPQSLEVTDTSLVRDAIEESVVVDEPKGVVSNPPGKEREREDLPDSVSIAPPENSRESGNVSLCEEEFSVPIAEVGPVLPPNEAMIVREFPDPELSLKDVDIVVDLAPNESPLVETQTSGLLDVGDDEKLVVQDTTACRDAPVPDSAPLEKSSCIDKEVIEEEKSDANTGEAVGLTEELSAPDSQLKSVTPLVESELASEDISPSKALVQEKEDLPVDILLDPKSNPADLDNGLPRDLCDVKGKSSEMSPDPESKVQEAAASVSGGPGEGVGNSLSGQNPHTVTGSGNKMHNGQSLDEGASAALLPKDASHIQSENIVSVEDDNSRGILDSTSSLGISSSADGENPSTSMPEVKQPGSKKKKKKEIFAKADAQGPTADLFTAYKAPEEKKLDEVKRADVPGSTNPGTDMKKDSASSSEKPVLKELDDWEDAAELPTPKIAPIPLNATPNVILLPGEAESPGDLGIKKYTKDYLMSQKDLYKDLPPTFELRQDVAEVLLNQGGFADALPSPGRGLDRQSSGGPRLDRRNSNLGSEDDRWTRQAGPVASPGRGPADARMEMGMPGPAGGFRPGQGSNAGLMRMPPGIRPGMGPPGIMPMSGLLPGGPLLPQHMMMPQGPGRNIGGIDADRWQRAPVGQKGLIPSPRTPLPAIHKTENRYQVGKVSDEEQVKQRLIKGILNKLTPQNFDKLFAQVKEVNIDSATTLTGVISQIFDKALTEPTFCEMYAKFCSELAVALPEFVEEEEKITFKRVLLNKCQEEFERGEREQEEAEKLEEDGEVKLTAEEREEKRTAARRRMLGNIRFIGELYKKNMLTERIMHECIKKLLGEYQNPDEEDVEALCKLMSTIGRIIDHPKAKEHIDAYFKRMEKLSENLKLSSRLRFMLKDCIDLRRNGWQERRKVEGPKKIDEVHRDAVQERQQAAASGRDRPQQRGGMVSGGRRPGNDFPMRGAQSPMFSQGAPMGGGMGMRGGQPPPGSVRGGFVQDVRMEDRLLMDSRPVPMPLSQRSSDDGPITLGPQGGLGRGMGVRQPLVPGRSALADVPPMMIGDARRPGMGPMPGFGGMVPDRGPYGREDMSLRGPGSDRSLGTVDRPLLERPLGPERLGPPMSGRDLSRSSLERPGLSVGSSMSHRPMTPPAPAVTRSSPAASIALSEDELKKKSISTITEYFSVLDMKEVAQCVADLKNPKYHPAMVATWVSEALERKDLEREHLVKLFIHICKEMELPMVTPDQISKGFELVLSMLEDTTVDVPKAPEFVAGMLAKLIIAGVFTLVHVGKLLKEGGMDAGGLVVIGEALNMMGVVLDTIRREKGEAFMVDLYRSSKLNLEDFLSSEDKRKGGKFEAFLEKKNLQCLYPMIPVEKYFRDAFDRDEPVAEILKWVERNVPQSTFSESAFLRMIMTQVLRHSVPLDGSGKVMTPQLEGLEGKIEKFAPLLKSFLPTRSSGSFQNHYIVAVQLFANDLGHPPGLISTLFSNLYRQDVISEQAFLKWQDDVKDSTPGRDKAIKDTFNWFRWLVEAPEEGGDDDE